MNEQLSIYNRFDLLELPNRPVAMLDRDVALFYDTSTKQLNQQIKRNSNWFNEKHVFQLTTDELSAVTNCDRSIKSNQFLPYAFTQQGAYSVAFLINTDTAIQKRDEIVELFVNFQQYKESKAAKQSIQPTQQPPIQSSSAEYDFLKDIRNHNLAEGSLDQSLAIRKLLCDSMSKSSLSRFQIAAQISVLCKRHISKSMLDKWTAESSDYHRFPSDILAAFCYVVKSNDLLNFIVGSIGLELRDKKDYYLQKLQELESAKVQIQNIINLLDS